MSYNIYRETRGDFDAVTARVKDALKTEGFGVLTEIDVAGTLKAKIHQDFRPYRILGACNPKLAYQALSAEPHIGVMLPCNVIVQRHDDGEIEISSIDPATVIESVGKPGACCGRGSGAGRAGSRDRKRVTVSRWGASGCAADPDYDGSLDGSLLGAPAT